MSMRGSAFLPIWHDIGGGMEGQYDLWHTQEHLLERVRTPGMIAGRRYENAAAETHRYFILYEASSFDVFSSEGYFATANARSEWTCRIDPYFTNFLRAPCHLVMTRGHGLGGALATARVRLAQQGPDMAGNGEALTPKDRFNLQVRHLVDRCRSLDLVTGVHIGIKGDVTRRHINKNSMALRPEAMAFDAVLLMEAASVAVLAKHVAVIEAMLEEQREVIASYQVEKYNLAQLVTTDEW
jgi:hypothetical protein